MLVRQQIMPPLWWRTDPHLVRKIQAFRVSTLAKFLIDGDPQRKLRKSVTELEKYDQKGLSDCKRLAIAHSKQLFEIYQQKKEDPFFLS